MEYSVRIRKTVTHGTFSYPKRIWQQNVDEIKIVKQFKTKIKSELDKPRIDYPHQQSSVDHEVNMNVSTKSLIELTIEMKVICFSFNFFRTILYGFIENKWSFRPENPKISLFQWGHVGNEIVITNKSNYSNFTMTSLW